MKTKRNHEGYLLIDNRAAGGPLFESATTACASVDIARIPSAK